VTALTDAFRAEPIYLAPILTSLIVAVLCASLILTSTMDIYNVTPFPEGFWSFGNALYFVALAAVGASLLYLLLKRKNFRLVSFITGFAFTIATFMLSVIYLYAAFSVVGLPQVDILVFVLSFAITVAVDFAVFKTRSKASGIAILFLGGALGAFLGISIPPQSTLLILIFLAIYDVFAVYRGPVGKIAHRGLEQLRGLSFSFKNIQVGLGDLTFYSMLVSGVLVNAGPIFCTVSITGVLIGAFLALKMLEGRGVFPGLPLPIALGLLPLIVSIFSP
jgi:presenilin-like A22 family membrane protease